jgi:hypothetical protein
VWSAQTIAIAVNLGFLDRSLYCFFQMLLNYPHEDECTLFQIHCFSENLVAQGIETGASASVAKNSDH